MRRYEKWKLPGAILLQFTDEISLNPEFQNIDVEYKRLKKKNSDLPRRRRGCVKTDENFKNGGFQNKSVGDRDFLIPYLAGYPFRSHIYIS